MKWRRRRRLRLGASAARRLARIMILQLPSLIALVWALMRDRRVSGVDRALFASVLAYVIAPVDLIPDFLGVLGFVDDLYLVGLALARLLGRSGPDLLLEHWRGDPEQLGRFVGSIEELASLLPRSVRRILSEVAEDRSAA